MINIVFFVSGLDSGGLENYLLRFLQYKHSSYNTVYIYCKSGKGGQLEDDYLKLDNVVIVKDKIGFLSFNLNKKLSTFIYKNNISGVCDFTGNFAGRIMLAAKNSKVAKRVAFYRGSSDHFENSFFKALYNKWVKYLVYKNATNILSNSKAAFDFFYPDNWRYDNRCMVIYNGINPYPFLNVKNNLRENLGIPANSFVIGHTGRFNPAKNHKVILEVAKFIISKYPDTYFILCGNGVKKNLQHYLNDNNLAHRILVFDNRADIPEFLNTMDCYLFPSITEGQPNALIEAMVMGLPFVASDIPPIRETVGSNYKLCGATNESDLIKSIEVLYDFGRFRNKELSNEVCKRFDYKKKFNEFHLILND